MVDMFMDEYDEEKIARLFRRDGYRDGYEEGLQEGRLEALAGLVHDGLLDISIAAERAGTTEDEIRRAMEGMEKD